MMANKKKEPTGQKPSKKIAIEDVDLWHSISGSVNPISSERKNRASHLDIPGLENKKKSPRQTERTKKSGIASKTQILPQKITKAKIPQLTGIDRRSKQKLLRGNVDIDARIDLHGATQIEAPNLLKNFFLSAQKRGAVMVLVITGKGASPYTRHILHSHDGYASPEREGVLRKNFSEWMRSPDFAHLVSGFQPAHPKHGGGGAFYVKLRKIKK